MPSLATLLRGQSKLLEKRARFKARQFMIIITPAIIVLANLAGKVLLRKPCERSSPGRAVEIAGASLREMFACGLNFNSSKTKKLSPPNGLRYPRWGGDGEAVRLEK